MLFNTLLVPVDGSEHSRKAAEYARGIARTQGSTVVLMHCFGHIPMIVGGSHREQLLGQLNEEGQQLLAPFRDMFADAEFQVEELVVEGNPADAICGTAVQKGADLIIIGSRGLSDIEGVLLGSVSHTVVNRATSPVLVVR